MQSRSKVTDFTISIQTGFLNYEFHIKIRIITDILEKKQILPYAFWIACRLCWAIPEVQILVQYSGNQIIEHPFTICPIPYNFYSFSLFQDVQNMKHLLVMKQEVKYTLLHKRSRFIQHKLNSGRSSHAVPCCLQLVSKCKHAAKGDQSLESLRGCHMPPQEEKVCNIFNVQQWLLPYECRWRHNL